MEPCLPKDDVVLFKSIASTRQLFVDVLRPMRLLQRVLSHLASLVPKLLIQQVVFDNTCKLLLCMVARSRQDVENMFEDPNHPMWSNTNAHQHLESVMTNLYHLCLKSLEHIRESLGRLHSELPTREIGVYKFCSNASWLSTFDRTKDSLDLFRKLRHYNDLFSTSILQATPRRSGRKLGSSIAEDLGYPYATEAAAPAIDNHTVCIQRASQILYDTLSSVWTCYDHDAHSLSISLDFDYEKAGATVQAQRLQFNVAVTSSFPDGPCRLLVISVHGEFCTCQTLGDDSSSNKMYLGNKFAEPVAWTKALDSSDADPDTVAYQARGQMTELKIIQNGVPDLASVEDLCLWLRKSTATTGFEEGADCSCLGFLTGYGRRLMAFYVLRDENQKHDSHSLDDVLTRASNERRIFSMEDRLRLASILATAVLHLHTSSWLSPAWSSKDVYFFEMKDCSESYALGEPYLQTQLNNNAPRRPSSESDSPAESSSPLVSLGLVLIELAFSTPWRKLQLREDITEGLSDIEKFNLNLIHLSENVSRELGMSYAKVVQTCLFQDSRARKTHGLGKAKLDENVFGIILKELDQCLSAVTSGM